MRHFHTIALTLLFVLVMFSLAANAFLIYRLSRVQSDVVAMIRQTSSSLKTLEGETITYTIRINQVLPISAQIPINESFNVPISATVPIRTNVPIHQNVDIPLSVSGFQLPPLSVPINIDVPIDVEVPVDLNAPVHLQRNLSVSTTVPLNLDVPIIIPISNTPLARYIDELRRRLNTLDLSTMPVTP